MLCYTVAQNSDTVNLFSTEYGIMDEHDEPCLSVFHFENYLCGVVGGGGVVSLP